MKCRFCSKALQHVLINLGHAAPSNFFLEEQSNNKSEVWYPLVIYVCDKCWLVQTKDYLNSDKILNSILTNLNINFNEFQLIISDQKIKNKLTVQTNEAYNKGVFGAPSFIINNKLFWGQDRLEFVLKEAQR